MSTRRWLVFGIAVCFACGVVCLAAPAAAKPEKFLGSEDAEEPDEPQTYLPDYSKLIEGQDADWVYFPEGALRSHKKVEIRDFESNAKAGQRVEAKHAADYVPDYLAQWLDEGGFQVVNSGGDMVIEGNVFNAWEPSGGARFWGGWMANPGCGLEVIVKDADGKVLGYVRHKARGSTIPDAVENGLEEIVKAIAKGK